MRNSVEIPGPPPRRDARVISVQPHAGGLFTLRLDAAPVAFTPGDCIAVYAPDGKTTRPYSLSGGTGDPYLELLIRRIPGGVLSDWLSRRSPGDLVQITPPFGWFRPADPPEAPKIWFATGSGIAPILSALRSGANAPVAFYWGVRRAEDLDGITIPGVTPCISGGPVPTGRITGHLQQVRTDVGIHYSLCGLDAMIEEVSAWLEAKGVSPSRIQRECFFTDGG